LGAQKADTLSAQGTNLFKYRDKSLFDGDHDRVFCVTVCLIATTAGIFPGLCTARVLHILAACRLRVVKALAVRCCSDGLCAQQKGPGRQYRARIFMDESHSRLLPGPGRRTRRRLRPFGPASCMTIAGWRISETYVCNTARRCICQGITVSLLATCCAAAEK
jgi:hypothetical protein